MRNPHMSRLGLVFAISLALTGCASKQIVPIECPSYVPSPEALAPMQGTDWKTPAQRLIEYYTTPSRHLGEGQR
jgi:PBP1b-binding outer membrane lipoprotein LpoB